MKNIIIIFVFVLLNTSFARPKVNIDLKTAIHSNIDRLKNPLEKGLNVNSLGFNFKYKKKLAKKVILVGLPLGLVDYAPSSREQLRLLNLNHSLLGIYIPNSKNIFVSNFNLGFNRSLTNFNNGIIDKNQSATASLGLTYTRKFTKKLGVDFGVDGKISDFSTEYDAINAPGEEDDNFKIAFKASPKYVLDNHFTFTLPFEVSNQLYKGRRNLLSNGAFGGLQADQIRARKVSLDTNYKNRLLTLKTSLGFEDNTDLALGGRSRKGAIGSFDLKYYFKTFVLDSTVSYKMQEYDTQLVNTLDANDKRNVYLELLTLKNKLTFAQFLKTKHSLILEHQFLKNNSNRNIDKNTNQVFSLGMKFTI